MQQFVPNNWVVVDPSGNIYFFMMQGSFDLVQLNSSGAQQWDLPVSGTPNGLFAWHDSSGAWAAAVVMRQPSGVSELVTPAGAVASGSEPVPGTGNNELATSTPSGGLVYTDGSYVHVLGTSGSPVAASAAGVPEFGSPSATNTTGSDTPGAPFSFYQIGGVAEVGSTVYVADSAPWTRATGSTCSPPQACMRATRPLAALGNLSANEPLYYDATTQALIFGNSSGVASVPLSGVQALVSSPAPPTQDGFGDTLGVGAGLTTSATAGYFPPGTTPSVTASFDPWWASYPDPLELSYWAASGDQVTAGALPAPTVVALSWSGVASGSSLQVPIAAPSTPGVYLVNADLVDTTTSMTIGSTCLTYSVGTAGDTLDFSGLSPGADYGGPAPERGVQLASELGTGAMREGLNMSTLLPACNAAAPTAATCGPSALTNWSGYDPATEQAAAEAKALGVDLKVQVGQDVSVDEALVSSGYWQEDVEAIMEHFASTAPDLSYVEAWNEPNTGPYSPATYVGSILEPFYLAVRAANAADGKDLQVIGGSVCGMDVAGWWTGIAKAGGFSFMNIAGIHPYPGYDRSFEEEGTPAAIVALKSLMASYGAASMPIWDTEQGWWSDGEEAFYDVGNWAPRKWMWLRSLGITSWDYFITEGQFDGFGTDYSLIDAANGDYFVKPGAIGLMTVSNLLGDRPFISQVNLGIPHAYGMLFGPPADGSATNEILAVWTDDLQVLGKVSLTSGTGSVTIATTGALGASGSLTVSASSPAPIELSGAPLYLSVPAGDTISVGPAESFGPNMALASAGASASASSSQLGDNTPSAVIQGNAGAENGGGIGSTPAWASQQGDSSPWVQVSLPSAETVDRVIVSTSSVASVLPGLRDYSIELYAGGAWTTAASVSNEFFARMEELSFPAVQGVTAIKVLPTALDLNSQLGGLAPYCWGPSWPDYAVVYSVEAYTPGSDGVATTTTTTSTTTTTDPPTTTTTSSTTTTTAPAATTTAPTTITTDPRTTTTTSSTTTTTAPAATTTAPTTITTDPPTTTTTSSTTTTTAPAATTTAPTTITTDPPTTTATTSTMTTTAPATTTTAVSTTTMVSTMTPGAPVTTGTKTTTRARTTTTTRAPTKSTTQTGHSKSEWSFLSFPRTVQLGASLPVQVRLTGRLGVPSGSVEVELGNVVLCRVTLKHGAAVCKALVPTSGRVAQGHVSRRLDGRISLAVVYQGDKTYYGAIREIVVTVTAEPQAP